VLFRSAEKFVEAIDPDGEIRNRGQLDTRQDEDGDRTEKDRSDKARVVRRFAFLTERCEEINDDRSPIASATSTPSSGP
jgi:hypothetical protein